MFPHFPQELREGMLRSPSYYWAVLKNRYFSPCNYLCTNLDLGMIETASSCDHYCHAVCKTVLSVFLSLSSLEKTVYRWTFCSRQLYAHFNPLKLYIVHVWH